MSLYDYLRHINPGNCVFSVTLYTVFGVQLLFPKFPEHAVDFVFLSVEKVFTAASPVNLQKDRVYAPSNETKRDIAAEHLLRCRPMFSSSLMVSVAVSKLGCTELFFVEPGVKVNGRYYREVLLKKQMLPVICVALPVTRTCFSRTAHRRTVLARQFSCCSRRPHNLSPRSVAY